MTVDAHPTHLLHPLTHAPSDVPLTPLSTPAERQYRCLGTWQEDGVLYTYTQRLDALSYECFAGRVMPDGRVFIGDAGTQQGCRRAVDPATSGMLIKSIGRSAGGHGLMGGGGELIGQTRVTGVGRSRVKRKTWRSVVLGPWMKPGKMYWLLLVTWC